MSGVYHLQGTNDAFGVAAGPYTLRGVPSEHPIRVSGPAGCAVTMTGGTVAESDWAYGDVTIVVPASCISGTRISLDCAYHGTMGGTDRLTVQNSCTSGTSPLLSPPPPSPPPPISPQLPEPQWLHVPTLEMSFIAEGSLQDYDELHLASISERLAAHFGVDASAVSTRVEAASVLIESNVTFSADTLGAFMEARKEEMDATSLQELGGILELQLLSKEPANIGFVLVRPESQQPTEDATAYDMFGKELLIVILGLLVLELLRRRLLRRCCAKPLPPPPPVIKRRTYSTLGAVEGASETAEPSCELSTAEIMHNRRPAPPAAMPRGSLPPGWHAIESDQGRYYYNEETGASQWEPPMHAPVAPTQGPYGLSLPPYSEPYSSTPLPDYVSNRASYRM